MGVLNAAKRFRNAARETELYSKHPRRIREVFNIREVNEDGIFTIQRTKGSAIYDRCYIFTDTNFVNKDPDQQDQFLEENMMVWLNSMTVHFKITMANEYRDVHAYIHDLTRDRHREEHDVIGEGVDAWIEEKLANGEVQDLDRVMYLTITTEAVKRETAKNYFLKMDTQLERLFGSMGSEIRPLSGKERLETLRRLFHPDETECPVRYDFRNRLKDPMNTVLPVSLEQEKNWMMFCRCFFNHLCHTWHHKSHIVIITSFAGSQKSHHRVHIITFVILLCPEIRISDEDYERAVSILNKSDKSMAELISRSLRLLEESDGEKGGNPMGNRELNEELKKNRQLLYRLIRTVCPLTEEDVNDPEFGIGLVDIYEDKNKHPEKYR